MSEENWIGRSIRHDTDVQVLVYRPNGERVRALVTEMSEGGCRLESDTTFPIGETLKIALPRMGQIRAQVRWSLGNAAGVRFDNHSYN